MSEYYYSFDDEMKARFGGKVYRLSLSAARTCPNRDGHCGTGGCIFCSAGGSGDFAESPDMDIHEQIELAKERVRNKLGRNFAGYMAYFQSFTETYGDQDHLGGCFIKAAEHPEILALSIATRPDSIEDSMIELLQGINACKPVYVELGLQTVHEDTAEYINRGYRLPVFEECFHRLKAAGLRVVAHVIIGLPGEDAARTKETVSYLAGLRHCGSGYNDIYSPHNNGHIDGIKLQLLHVLKGTRLAELMPGESGGAEAAYNAQTKSIILNDGKKLTCYNVNDYAELIRELVEMLPETVAVHRLTGDAPKRLLIYPAWSADKKKVLNAINRTFREAGLRNGAQPVEKE